MPLIELATLALREGRRPRAIYVAHKWFARRLGTIFRALLVGAVSPPDSDFWRAYYGSGNLQGLTVLDPFVGGGTSVVEATRLGATAIAIDVDPVACAVTNQELKAADLPDLDGALATLLSTVGEALRPFHTFTAPDSTSYQVLHHFWVQVVTCAGCGTDFDAHPNFQLAYDGVQQWVFCAHCGQIHHLPPRRVTFVCNTCGKRTAIMAGRAKYGKATCPRCGVSEPLIEVGRRTDAPPSWRQFAVEVLTQPDGGRAVPLRHRRFFPADHETSARFAAATAAYLRRQSTHPATVPTLAISRLDRHDSRLIDYGYRRWTELFNARQLLHLSLLTEAIAAFDEPTRTALSLALSDHLTTNCMLTSYAAGWRRLSPLFSIRAFRHVPRPVELNPWVTGSGRGSFPNTVRKLMRAASYARCPKEPVLSGGFRTVATTAPARSPRVYCGTARDLSFLDDASVDLVLTDPPYFDNIAYSELAEFFLPWLQLLGVVSADRSVSQVRDESLGGRRSDPETVARYQAGLSAAFAEIARVLKPAGMIMFSFRHARPEAWLALANALAPQPLVPVRVLPAPGEAGVGLHAHPGTGLWDAVFIFRRSAGEDEPVPKPLRLVMADLAAVDAVAGRWATRLTTASIAFTAIDRLTIRRAALIRAALQCRGNQCADEAVSLAEALCDAT
ncbi:MAG: DNA methyltransferase [Dehalococcoidia bacterium]